MNKKIVLVRHGEALPTDLGSVDYERILSERGKEFVRFQGGKLNGLDRNIDYVIASSATRTKQTSILIANELSFSTESIHFEDKIYEAPIHRLLEVFDRLPQDKDSILWVGHNPGISHLHYYLTGDPFSFVPGNVSVVDLDIDEWVAHFEGCGQVLKTF